jgi:hypothetical protein
MKGYVRIVGVAMLFNVTYSYDTHNPPLGNVTSFAKGRLTRTEAGTTVRTADSYDELGRVARSTQTTRGTAYSFGTSAIAGYQHMNLNPAVDLSAGACNALEDVETGRDARRI